MSNTKEFLRKNALVLGLAALMVVIVLGASFVISSKTQELATAKENLGKANDQIVKLTQDLGSLTTDAEQAKKNETEAKRKADALALDLEAFAKQAAACESLKKQIQKKK